MVDVFISYKREERPIAKRIADAIAQAGYTVWWDVELLPGDSFVHEIEEVIKSAKIGLVLWSDLSVKSEWVVAEALKASDRGVYMGAMFSKDVHMPGVFYARQSIDLSVAREEGSTEAIAAIVKDAFEARIGPPSPDAAHVTAEERLTAAESEASHWKRISDSVAIKEFRGYLERYGTSGVFAGLAQARIRALEAAGRIPFWKTRGFRRFAAGVAALALLGVGAWTGFWYYVRGELESAVKDSQLALERSGVIVEYDALSVFGYPFAHQARFENLSARVPAENVVIRAPEVTAVTDPVNRAVIFSFPSAFTIAATGGDDPAAAKIATTGFDIVVSTLDAGRYKVRAEAESARVTSDAENGGVDALENTALTFFDARLAGELAVNYETDAKSGSLDFGVAKIEATEDDSTVALTVNGVGGALSGDDEKLDAGITIDAVRLADDALALTAFDVAFDAVAWPKAGYDAERLFQTPELTTANVLKATLIGLGDGGRSNIAFTVGAFAVRESADDPLSAFPTLDIEKFEYRTQASEESLSLLLKAALLKFDSPTFASDAGATPYSDGAALRNAAYRFEVTPADTLDLAPIARAETLVQLQSALAGLVLSEFQAGGGVSLSVEGRQNRFSFVLPADANPTGADAPFGVEFVSDVTRSALTVRDGRASFTGEVGPSRLAAASGETAAGDIALAGLDYAIELPLTASDAVQKAEILFDLDKITLSPDLWDAIDPNGRLPRQLNRLRLELSSDLLIGKDLLTMLLTAPAAQAAFLSGATVQPTVVDLEDFTADLLDFRAIAGGRINFDDTGPSGGALGVTLRDWAPLVERLRDVPIIGGDPILAPNLDVAEEFLSTYGVAGVRAGETRLDFKFSEDAVTVNGISLDEGGDDAPASAPRPDAAADPAEAGDEEAAPPSE